MCGSRIEWELYSSFCLRDYKPVILATQEAEIRRIEVRSQLGQIVCETLSQKKKKKTHHKKVWWSGSRCRPWVQNPVLQKREKKVGPTCQKSYYLYS
jgi:hypothetical protein